MLSIETAAFFGCLIACELMHSSSLALNRGQKGKPGGSEAAATVPKQVSRVIKCTVFDEKNGVLVKIHKI